MLPVGAVFAKTSAGFHSRVLELAGPRCHARSHLLQTALWCCWRAPWMPLQEQLHQFLCSPAPLIPHHCSLCRRTWHNTAMSCHADAMAQAFTICFGLATKKVRLQENTEWHQSEAQVFRCLLHGSWSRGQSVCLELLHTVGLVWTSWTTYEKNPVLFLTCTF